MVYLEKDDYRIASIYNIVTGERPVIDGLAIEKKCFKDKDAYYVICFVKFNKKEQDIELEFIGDRILEIDNNEFELFKELIRTARQFVKTVNLD